MSQLIKFTKTPDGLVSLNDLYQQAVSRGLADGKLDPRQWARTPKATKSGTSGRVTHVAGPGHDFIVFVAENLKVDAAHVYKTSKARADRGGGTFAHWQIALAYAKYLSHELHAEVNETYARAQAGDVTLSAEVADRATPEDQEWLAARMQGKVSRNRLTDTLKTHGVTGLGYGQCTNAVYLPILGAKAEVVKKQKGLPAKANLRDALDLEQVFRIGLAEIVAKKRIEQRDVHGNNPCARECGEAAQEVARIQ